MFVLSNNRREFYKNNFNDKELPVMGDISERFVYLISRLFDSSTAATPHTIIFDMSNEKNCNTPTVSVAVTPAQQLLLQELPVNEIPDLLTHLKTIHYNGTYEVQESQRSDLVASQNVLWLIQSLEKIQQLSTLNLKTA